MANHRTPCHQATCSLCLCLSSISGFLSPPEYLRDTHIKTKQWSVEFSSSSRSRGSDMPSHRANLKDDSKAPLTALGYPGAQPRNLRIANPSCSWCSVFKWSSEASTSPRPSTWCIFLLQFFLRKSGPGSVIAFQGHFVKLAVQSSESPSPPPNLLSNTAKTTTKTSL